MFHFDFLQMRFNLHSKPYSLQYGQNEQEIKRLQSDVHLLCYMLFSKSIQQIAVVENGFN